MRGWLAEGVRLWDGLSRRDLGIAVMRRAAERLGVPPLEQDAIALRRLVNKGECGVVEREADAYALVDEANLALASAKPGRRGA